MKKVQFYSGLVALAIGVVAIFEDYTSKIVIVPKNVLAWVLALVGLLLILASFGRKVPAVQK